MNQQIPKFLKLITEAKKRIREISPLTLKEKIDRNESFHLIDVREESEWEEGHIPKAIHIPRGVIEFNIEQQIPDAQAEIILYCSAGLRCALAADSLQEMGYKNVYSLETGAKGWVSAGYELL